MIPARGLLLVKRVETDETRPGGRIVLPASARERLTSAQCEVVAVGKPTACDDEDCPRLHQWDEETQGMIHACRVAVGDWRVVQPRAFVATPDPEANERLVKQDNVLAILQEAL